MGSLAKRILLARCLLLLLLLAHRSEHTLPVTSMYLGFGEANAILVTASLDRSLKIWQLATGQLLRSINLPAGVTVVTLDAGEHVLLAGCTDGTIWEVSLVGPAAAETAPAGASAAGAAAAASASPSSSGIMGGAGSCCYEGHSKAISSLHITPDGEQLVSGVCGWRVGKFNGLLFNGHVGHHLRLQCSAISQPPRHPLHALWCYFACCSQT
jgi:WD40 repeat protein